MMFIKAGNRYIRPENIREIEDNVSIRKYGEWRTGGLIIYLDIPDDAPDADERRCIGLFGEDAEEVRRALNLVRKEES